MLSSGIAERRDALSTAICALRRAQMAIATRERLASQSKCPPLGLGEDEVKGLPCLLHESISHHIKMSALGLGNAEDDAL